MVAAATQRRRKRTIGVEEDCVVASRREESALDRFCTVTRKWPSKYVKNVYRIKEYILIYLLCAFDFTFFFVVYMS